MPEDNLTPNTASQDFNQEAAANASDFDSSLEIFNENVEATNDPTPVGKTATDFDTGLEVFEGLTTQEEVGSMLQGLKSYGLFIGDDAGLDYSNPTPIEGLKDNLWSTDWLNDFMITINENELNQGYGKKLEYDRQVLELEDQKNITETADIPEEQKAKQIEELSYKQMLIQSSEEYRGLVHDIETDKQDLQDYEVSESYALNKFKKSQEEYTNPFGYMLYESAADLGGNFSDLSTLAASYGTHAGIMALGNWAASAVATGASGGGATPWLIQSSAAVAALGASAYMTLKMRENETFGEMAEAYKERAAKLIGEAQRLNGGPLTQEQETKVRLQAYEGIKQLKAQNMMLSSSDIFQTAMMAIPWGKSFGLLKGTSSFAGRTAGRFGASALSAITEGMEETSQYQMKKHFVDGLYRDGYTYQEALKEGINTFGSSARYALTGNTAENYENDPEFRNAFRSGAILGGGMHFTGAMKNQWQDRQMRKVVQKDIETLPLEDIEYFKNIERADLLTRVQQEYGIDNYIEVLKGMKGREGTDSKVIDFEIERAKEAKILKDVVDKQHANLDSDSKNTLLHTLMTVRSNHNKSEEDVKKAKIASEEVRNKYGTDSSVLSFDISEKLNRKKAVDNLIKDFKGLDKGPTNEKTLKYLEQQSKNLEYDIASGIVDKQSVDGKKYSNKEFDTFFDEEAVAAYTNEYHAEITSDRIKEDLNLISSRSKRNKLVRNIQRTAALQKQANKKAKAEATESKKEVSKEEPDSASKAIKMPDTFYTGEVEGVRQGFKKEEDGNWYEFDDSGRSKVVQPTKEMTAEEIVADAFIVSQANEQERQQEQQEASQATDLSSLVKGSPKQSHSSDAVVKKEVREANPNKTYGEETPQGELQDLSQFITGQSPSEKAAEEKANALYEEAGGTDRKTDNTVVETIVDGKTKTITPPSAPVSENNTTAAKAKQANTEKQGEFKDASSKDRGDVITSIEMIKTKNKPGGGDLYLEADPVIRHQEEFNFKPLLEPGRIEKGSNVYLEVGTYNKGKITKKDGVYTGQVHVFESNAKGEKVGSKPLTQLIVRFNRGRWSKSPKAKQATGEVFEYFYNNPTGNLVLKVADKVDGNIVNINPNELNLTSEERLANTGNVIEQSPWFLYGGKPTYAISKENFLLETGNNRINNEVNGVEATGKVAKNTKEGSTYLLVNDSNGNILINKTINRNVNKGVAKTALDNLRALPFEERQRYFDEVVSQIMYLDSQPKKGEAVNISIKDDLYFYKNTADNATASAKLTEEGFLDFVSKRAYRTAGEHLNSQARSFTEGTRGEGYSIPLTPLFKVGNQPIVFEKYNDYLQGIAVYTTIKADFPLHNTQIYLESLEQRENLESIPKNSGEQEAIPQGYTTPEKELKNTDEEMVNQELSQPVEEQVESPEKSEAPVKGKKKQRAKKSTLKFTPPTTTGEVKFKLKDSSSYKVWDKEQELQWLDENLPNVPVRVVDNLNLVHGKGGMNAWGSFSNGVIHLADNAETGTGYHEAFHAVFDLYLSPAQQLRLLKETGITDQTKAEEFLADEFRKYVLKDKNPAKTSGIKRFFNDIYLWVKDRLGLLKTEELFKYMDSGNYSRRTPKLSTNDQVKYKLIPTLTPTEQKHRVSSISYDFFEMLKKNQGVDTIYQIDPAKVNGAYIQDVFDSIFNWYDNEYQNAEEGSAYEAKTDSILENWGLLEEQAKQYIRIFGYQINTTETKVKEDTPEDSREVSPEDGSGESGEQRIYDRPSYEESAKKSLSREMKLFMSTIPTGEIDEYGRTRYYEFNETYSKVAQRMANSANLEEMENRLKALADTDPDIAYVAQSLNSATDSKQDGKTFNNFRSKFFSTFYTNYANFVTVRKSQYELEDSQASEAQGSSVYTYRNFYNVLDSNSAAQSRTIKDSWKESITKVQGTPVPGLVDNYKELEKKYKTGEFEAFSSGLSDLLNKVGIAITQEALYNGIQTESNHFNNSMFVSRFGVKQLLSAAEKGGRLLSVTAEESQDGVVGVGEEGTINKLAVLESLNKSNITGDAFRKSSGNTIHPIGMHNSVTAKIDQLKDHNYISTLAQEKGYENNTILNILENINGRESLQFAYFGEEYDSNKNKGTDFNKVVEGQVNRSKLNAFLNSGKKFGWFGIPTLGDKSTNGFVKLPKVVGNKIQFPMPYIQGMEGLNPGLVDKYIDMVKDEFMRIHREANVIDQLKPEEQIANYHYRKTPGDGEAKALYFQQFPTLNNTLEDVDLVGVDAEIAWENFSGLGIRTQVSEFIGSEIDAEINYFTDLGLFVKDEKGEFSYPLDQKNLYFKNNINIDSKSLNEYGSIKSQQIKNALAHYATSSFIFNSEFSNILGGDYALYKGKGDASKRFSALGTPGTSLYTGKGGAKPNFTLGVLKDNYVDRGSIVTMYEEFLTSSDGLGLAKNSPTVQRILEAYKNPNQTDAQGFITLDRYRDILIGQGQWTKTHQEEYKNLKEGKPTTGTIIMQPIKGIYSGTRNDGVRTTYDLVKYSSFPLIPAYTDQFPTLKSMREHMESKGFDEVVFDSAYKVGLRGASEDLGNMSQITLPNSNWRIPQVIPVKQQDSSNMGSQMRKLIFQNIPKGSPLESLKDTGQQLLNRLIDTGADKTLNTLESKEDVARIIRDQISERDLTELYEDAGQINDKGDFKMPISLPLISRRIESIVNSFIRKGITKGKMPGLQAVQVSSFGASKEDIGYDTDLKDVTFERTEDGWKVNPAEVYLSPEYFIKTFKKKGYDTSILFDSDGNFKEDAIPKELRKVVLYRIPTQGKNSMLPVHVKGFLPKESGSSIVMPASITSLAGSDFDIDKVFVEMLNFSIDQDNKLKKSGYSLNPEAIDKLSPGQVQNALADIHFKILTSPEVSLEFITPLDGEVIDSIRDQVEEVYNTSSAGPFGSNRYQSDTVLKNQAGKNLVGVYALHTTFHAVAQDIDLSGPTINFAEDTVEAPTTLINTIENNEDGSLVSDNFNESLNAAVDNAKDPKLGPINVNEFTAPVDALLTHYGRFKTAKYLLNQPIIRDYTKAFYKNITGNSRSGAIKDAQNEIENTYKLQIKPKDAITLSDVSKVSLKALEDSIVNNKPLTEEQQADVFHAYLALDSTAQDLNAMIIGLNSDTTGVAATVQGNILKEDRFKEGVLYNKSFTYDQDKLNKHSVYSYHQKGVVEPTEKLKNLFIWATEGMTRVHLDASEKFNKPLNEKELASLQYNFYSYLFTGNTLIGNTVNEKSDSLLKSGPKSFASRIEKFKNFEKEWESKYDYKASTFFSNLTTAKNEDGVDFVKFNNSAADAIDKLSKDTMTFEIEQLYNGATLPSELTDAERKAAKQLMIDLVPYAFLTGGFQKSTNSFTDYIPTAIWKGEFDIVGDHSKISNSLLDTTSNQTGVFLRQYVQNNPNTTLIRTHKVTEANTGKESGAQYYNARAKEEFIRDTEGNLYELVQSSNNDWSKYASIPVIGRGQYLQEYAIGKTFLKSSYPKAAKSTTKDVLKAFVQSQQGTKTQQQQESGMAVDTVEESTYKIQLMKELFAEQGVEVDIEMNADIDANAQIVYKSGDKPLIQIKNAFKDTVFHEFGHLYIDLLGPDHTLIKKAKNGLEGSPLYNEVKATYPHLSKEDLDNEVLATALGREGSEIFDSMQKANWWDRFVNLFFDVLNKIFPGLTRSAAKELANRMLTGQTEQLKLNHIVKADKIQKQVAEEIGPKAAKEVRRLENLKEDIIDTFTHKIKIYKTRPGSTEFIEATEKLVERLRTLDSKQSTITFTAKAYSDLKGAKEKLDGLAKDNKLTDSILYKYKDYATGYRILEEIEGALRSEGISIPDETKQELVEAQGYLKGIQDIYFEELPKLVANRMSKYSNNHSKVELENYFKKVDRDITITEAMADFMGDSKDPVLALLAKMTDEAMQNVTQEHQKFAQELHEKVTKLEKESSSKKDSDIYGWMLEKDDNGDFTGHYVSRFKSSYFKEKSKTFTAILDDVTKNKTLDGAAADKEISSRQKAWHAKNSTWAGNKYVPNSKWINPEYTAIQKEIQNSTAKGEFYRWFKDEYTKLQYKLPERHRKGSLLPVMRKSTSQRVQQAGSFKDGFGIVKEGIRDTFVAREDDIEKGLITNEAGRPLDAVPVFYTSENVEVKDRIFNIEELLSKFSYMALEYSAKNDLVDTMEGARELVKKRKITKENSKGEKVLNAVKDLFNREVIEKEGAESNALKQLDQYIKMVYYGQKDIDHGSLNVFGQELDYQKAAKKLINVTSYLGMSFNFMANVSNISVGETTNLAEAFAGEFYTLKDWAWGHKEWTANSGALAADLYKKKPTNKISIVSDRVDLLGDYRMGISNPKNTLLKKAGSISPSTALQDLGERMMQQSVMMAMLRNVKVTDKNGDKVDGIDTAWDAINTDKGYVEIDPRVDLDLNKESRKINALIRRMQGNYNENTPVALQRHALGKLALQYRKWVRPGYMRRWENERYNEFLEADTFGSYRDFYTVTTGLMKDVAQLRFAMVSEKWSALSDREKQNFARTITEIGFFTMSAGVLAAMFMGEDEGPGDDWWSMFLYYQMKRYQSEMTFFVGVGTMDILRSPAASMSTMELSYDLLAQFLTDTGSVISGGEMAKYKTGHRKGDLKIAKKASKLLFPLSKQVEKLSSEGLEEQLKYFNLKK